MRCETEVSRFGKCINFRLTLVTDQYCAIQSNPLFELIHQAQLKTFLFFHLVLLTSTISDSLGILTSLSVYPFNRICIFGNRKMSKGLCWSFDLSLKFFHTESCFCFWSLLSRQGTSFAALCFMFTCSLKCITHIV